MRPITVTMLGPTGSGKTTYLHGMFAHFALGDGVYGMFERDWDRGLDLERGWRALTDEGVLPEATDENPQFYEFVVQRGSHAVVDLHWSDFRGGALFSRTAQHADVATLQQRLTASDSIHLVLDGGVLAAADLSATAGLANRLGAPRMSGAVRQAIDTRATQGLPLPSVVVLVTKADRIVTAGNGGPGVDRLAEVVDAVVDMLPILRHADVTSMVCPVRVGWFGQATGQVDPATVAPHWLHQPVLFTAHHHCVVEERGHRAVLDELDRRIAADGDALRALLDRPLAAVLDRRERRELTRAIESAQTRRTEVARARDTAAYWADALSTAIEPGVPIFHQGGRIRGGTCG